jgi:hypothetical protein
MILNDLTPTATLEQVAESLQGLSKELSKASPLMREKAILEATERLVELGLKRYKKLVRVALDFKKKGRKSLDGLTTNVIFPNSLTPNDIQTGEMLYREKEKNEKGFVEKNVGGGVTQNPWTFKEVISKLTEGLEVIDTEGVRIVLATVVSHYIRGDNRLPMWLLVVGPPSSGKTEMITMLKQHPQVYALSELTPKTLVSGMDVEKVASGEDPSLLLKLKDNILAVKDLTTMLSMNRDDKRAIFGQLREVFDGSYKKVFGTGQTVDWEGHMTFLAGVTAEIDRQWLMIQALGPRFLFLRLQLDSRDSVSLKALKVHKKWKEELTDGVGSYFRNLPYGVPPELSEEQIHQTAALANLISKARSVVQHDKDGDVEEVYEAEMPARIVKQMASLLQALAMTEARREIDDTDMQALVRVGFDTLPPRRAWILKSLIKANRPLTVGEMRKGSAFDFHVLDQAAGDMKGLEVLEEGVNDSKTITYTIHPSLSNAISLLRPFFSPGES